MEIINATGAPELIETELETFPDTTGVIRSDVSFEGQLALAANIEKLVEAQNKIRMTLLRLSQAGDWVLFGDGEKEKAELDFAGAMRIGSTLGVNFTNWSAEKESGTDNIGQWFRWNHECDAIFRERLVRVYGRASSRDKFFGKVRGEYKQLIDIDEGNIRMASRRGAMKEGVKVLFGLHHMDPKELSKFNVPMIKSQGHVFKKAEEQANDMRESESVSVMVKSVTKKEGSGWVRYTITDTDGAFYTTFSKSIAAIANDSITLKTLITIHFTSGKYGNEIREIIPFAKTAP